MKTVFGLVALLAWPSLAMAHGNRFSLSAISIAPDDSNTWWANANGWGVVYTTDAGASWTWRCEEGIPTQSVYDLIAVDGQRALLATSDGLETVGADCVNTPLDGLPADAFATVVARANDGYYAAIYAAGSGGLYRCALDASPECVATELQGLYVKSVAVSEDADGERIYATSADATTLAERLWTSTDGQAFTAVADWPDGDVDLRILAVDDGRLWLWRIPRTSDGTPTLLFSADHGMTYAEIFSDGLYTDPVPGMAVDGNDVWLGSDVGRTWRSMDGGRHFSEVSDVEPAVRCSDKAGDLLLVCADHFADGFDVGIWDGGQRWAGAGCLDAAAVDSCGGDTCQNYHDAFVTAGAYGGGSCYVTPAAGPPTCGCSGDSATALLFVPITLLFGAARSRRRRTPAGFPRGRRRKTG